MNYLFSLVISGIFVGTLYGILAMGFAVIYKVSGVVNFAHGEVMMLIAYIAYTVAALTDSSAIAVSFVIIAAAVVIGVLIERLIIRPMLGQPTFSVVMMTIALAFIIRASVGLIWGADPHSFPGAYSKVTWNMIGITILPLQAALMGIYIALSFGMWAFLRYSIVGIAMRATESDPTVSLLMGVSVSRMYRVAWILSAFLAGIAGVFFASLNSVGIEMANLGTRAFPASILGGLDSVLGSGIAGIMIGIVENLAGGYLGTSYKEAAGFALILIVLMIRPYGLFGERTIERV